MYRLQSLRRFTRSYQWNDFLSTFHWHFAYVRYVFRMGIGESTEYLYEMGTSIEINLSSQLFVQADFKVFLVTLAVFLSTGVVFIYCYVGTFTTEQFLLYADITYESKWYKFPVPLQKLLTILLAYSQRPRYFNGYGLIDLTLVTFTTVSECWTSAMGRVNAIVYKTNCLNLFHRRL